MIAWRDVFIFDISTFRNAYGALKRLKRWGRGGRRRGGRRTRTSKPRTVHCFVETVVSA
jgi:hypothetical protein